MAGSESIMTFALGFLLASLIALVLAAPLWRRAEKLTRKRLLSSLPISVEDVAAEKDKLRADFALSTRKLEMNLEKLRKKAQGQMTSVQQRNTKLIELETELKVDSETISDRESKIRELTEKLAATEAELKRRTEQMDDMKAKLGDLQSVLNRQAGAIKDAASLTEGHRDEIETLKTDIDEKDEQITRQASAISSRDAKLAECGERVAAQKLLVAEKTAELKEKAALVTRLKARIAEYETLHAKQRQTDEERSSALEAKDTALAAATEEIAALKIQLNAMAGEYRSRLAADNHENALLRQRIGDLAADVQRMTDALDLSEDQSSPAGPRAGGPSAKSANGGAKDTLVRMLPIDALETRETGDQRYPGTGEAAMVHKTASLADRIRSLQRGPVK